MSLTRLATYGTLVPGQVNEGQLSMLKGVWSTGVVRGHLVAEGWGADHGCPGIKLDPAGTEVAVHLFTSDELPDHWARLDAFEGDGYSRSEVQVHTAEGVVTAQIYRLSGV